MARTLNAIGGVLVVWIAMVWIATAGTPAAAEVLDAVYRGTLVCDQLPFTKTNLRGAIDVTIADGAARYTHVVRLREAPEAKPEQGTGTLKGQDISLQGAWDGGTRQYKASYSGTFVRRSAKLKGTQTWTDGGKTFTRTCSGAVKRRLKAFLPRNNKP